MIIPKVLVVNDTRVDYHYGCHAVMESIVALLEINGMRAAHFWPAHTEWRENNEFDSFLEQVELVIINSEGTIHHNKSAGLRLLELGAFVKKRGIPIALINAGWDANGPDMLVKLDDFDIIAARDTRSAERMKVAGAEVRVVPDLSLWHSIILTSSFSAECLRKGIGFSDNVDRLKSLKLEELRRACDGQTLSIFYNKPGQFSQLSFLRDGISLKSDLFHPVRLINLLLLRSRLWRHSSINHQTFIEQIAKLKLLVSGRFHSCTLALAFGTPVIAQNSNTDKIEALFHDAGLDCRRVVTSINIEEIYAESLSGWSVQENKNLQGYKKHACVSAERLFLDLQRLVAER